MSKVLVLLSYSALVRGDPVMPVFGHKAPDTDAVAAAMVYQWELQSRNIPAQAHRQGDLNPETEYVLRSLGLEAPPVLGELAAKTRVAIVDTNNPEELPSNLGDLKIHSIVDHHKLSGLKNAEPVEVDMRPLCSAGSILYARAKADARVPPRHIAGLMLSSIISDSLEFRSPTTTNLDRQFAEELAILAVLDVHQHAVAMFNAKANIDGYTTEQLVLMDSKVYDLGSVKVRVSVLETTQPSEPLARKAELVETQKAVAQKEGLDAVLFFVVDILNEAAIFIASSPIATKLVESGFKVKVGTDGTARLPGVLSRKKQIMPILEAAAKHEL